MLASFQAERPLTPLHPPYPPYSLSHCAVGELPSRTAQWGGGIFTLVLRDSRGCFTLTQQRCWRRRRGVRQSRGGHCFTLVLRDSRGSFFPVLPRRSGGWHLSLVLRDPRGVTSPHLRRRRGRRGGGERASLVLRDPRLSRHPSRRRGGGRASLVGLSGSRLSPRRCCC